MIRLHGELIRGGTSKCWIFAEEEVRATGHPVEEVLLAAFNARDSRQADGIGGASSTTSKAAIVAPSTAEDVDVDYTFAQVGVGHASVEWGSNCGNCATAVALYAAHRGLAVISAGQATVRMRNLNTGARLSASIPMAGRVVPEEGTASVPGVEGLGVPVALGFDRPVGSTTGCLLPTGHPTDVLRLTEGPWAGTHPATLVDAGAPASLVAAESLGLTGGDDLLAVRAVIPELTALRREAALAMGLVRPGAAVGHAIPKVGVVGAPLDYRTTGGEVVRASDHDVAVRMVSMHAPHPVIGLTSAVAVAVAALTPGTLVHRLLASTAPGVIRLGTPGGVVPVRFVREGARGFATVSLGRAARRLAESTVLVPLPEVSTAVPSSASLVGSGFEGQTACTTTTTTRSRRVRRVSSQLYVQVLGAVLLGALVGALWPSVGAQLKPLGDAFIGLIRMMIAPLIFCTVVTGIASIDNMRSVGRIAGKAMLYFELLTTVALALGLVVVTLVQPGAGMHIDPGSLSTAGLPPEASQPAEGFVDFVLGIIPASFLTALTGGEILPVLLVSVLFGFGLHGAGEAGTSVLRGVENISRVMFVLIRWIMRLAPIGAFGSMAYTIGNFGIGSLAHLGLLVGSFWLAALVFVFVGLGTVMRLNGLRLLPLLRYIREELLVVLGTSSSEPVLPRLMEKMQFLGASKPVVGLTLPAGYSFNLDGTALYLTMGAGFLAQALGVELSWAQWLSLLVVMMVSSKGAAGVTGSGFVALAATLSAVPHVPVAALALIFGVDRFMSEARALTSVVGNSVATIAVARWEGALDLPRARAVLSGTLCVPEADEAAAVTPPVGQRTRPLTGAVAG